MKKMRYALWVNPEGVNPITEQCGCRGEFATRNEALLATAKMLVKMGSLEEKGRVQLYNAARGEGGDTIINVEVVPYN